MYKRHTSCRLSAYRLQLIGISPAINRHIGCNFSLKALLDKRFKNRNKV